MNGERLIGGVEGVGETSDVASILVLDLDDGYLCLFNNSLNCVYILSILFTYLCIQEKKI